MRTHCCVSGASRQGTNRQGQERPGPPAGGGDQGPRPARRFTFLLLESRSRVTVPNCSKYSCICGSQSPRGRCPTYTTPGFSSSCGAQGSRVTTGQARPGLPRPASAPRSPWSPGSCGPAAPSAGIRAAAAAPRPGTRPSVRRQGRAPPPLRPQPPPPPCCAPRSRRKRVTPRARDGKDAQAQSRGVLSPSNGARRCRTLPPPPARRRVATRRRPQAAGPSRGPGPGPAAPRGGPETRTPPRGKQLPTGTRPRRPLRHLPAPPAAQALCGAARRGRSGSARSSPCAGGTEGPLWAREAPRQEAAAGTMSVSDMFIVLQGVLTADQDIREVGAEPGRGGRGPGTRCLA